MSDVTTNVAQGRLPGLVRSGHSGIRAFGHSGIRAFEDNLADEHCRALERDYVRE
jgi:hypothetical protein